MARRIVSNPLAAVAYLRVSTDDQKLGPEAQLAEIQAWAKRTGVTVVAVHVDQGVSGGADIADRPGLVAALDDLRTHSAGVLVAAKRDRIARDVVIAALVERAAKASGATLRTADGASDVTGPEGALMSGIVDLFAQYERGVIKARTKKALAVKIAKGETTGEAPYGMMVGADGVHLVACPAEQAVIARVRGLRAAGLSVRAITAALVDAGIVSPRSGKSLGKSRVGEIVAGAA